MSSLIGRPGSVGSTGTSSQRQADGALVFKQAPGRSSIRQILHDKRGLGVAEGLAGVVIILLTVSMIGVAATQDMGVVTQVAGKADRQAYVTALVGNKRATTTWGTPAAPHVENASLPNGATVKVATWREDDATSTTLTAVTASSGEADAPDCTAPSALAKTGCVYATRLHADDLDSLEPHAIIRATKGDAAKTGTVDPHVGSNTAIPQGTVLASGSDNTATVWRYLINGRALETTGEIRFTQGDKTLAVIPVDTEAHNYFGTFTAALNTPVSATVTSGDIVIQTVLVYRAGSTS